MASLEEALYAKLTSDATLMAIATGGVYNSLAIQSATYPLILFQQIRGTDQYTFTRRVSTQHRYQIKCINEGYDNEPCRAAMERIDTLLTDQTLTVTGKTFWMARRISEFAYAEPALSGKAYQHVGGDWLIELAPA